MTEPNSERSAKNLVRGQAYNDVLEDFMVQELCKTYICAVDSPGQILFFWLHTGKKAFLFREGFENALLNYVLTGRLRVLTCSQRFLAFLWRTIYVFCSDFSSDEVQQQSRKKRWEFGILFTKVKVWLDNQSLFGALHLQNL